MLIERQSTANVFNRTVNQMRNLLKMSLATIGEFEMPKSAQDLIDFFDHMNRQTNGARLIHDRSLNALPYPPCRIR